MSRPISLAELGPKLISLGRDMVPELGTRVLQRSMEVFFLHAVSISPERTGRYASSHRASVGAPRYARLRDAESYPRLGVSNVRSVAQTMRLDSVGYVTNDAARRPSGYSWQRKVRRARAKLQSYAPILDKGRHVDSRGRMAGSEQAPQGVYPPALAETVRRGKLIIVGAMKQMIAKYGL